ncbi:MAG: hypothetical protein WCH44_13430 [Betaproteobacteria bacterium]
MNYLLQWRSAALLASALTLAFTMVSVLAQKYNHHGARAEHRARAPRAQLASGVAFAPDGRLWLVGLDAEKRLFLQSTLQAAGASGSVAWSAPQRIETGADAIAADGENRPKLALGPNGWVVISYTQPLAKPFTGMIRMLRSSDGGKTFSAPFTVHADRQEITHRFESIAFDTKGVLHSLWIDKRDLELAPKAGKKSSYIGAAVYRNESRDGGATFGPDIKLADHSCECCRIALAAGRDGVLRALWRHVFGTNVRDHGFASVSTAGDGHFVRATLDDWHIDACPHHGPGLALAADDGFHAVWFGVRRQDAQDLAAVRYARLAPDGSPREDTVRALPDERAEHADVLAYGEHVAIVWRSVDGARSTLKAWLSTDSGKTFRLSELASVTGDNDHPRLAQTGERIVAVWRNSLEVQVHEIRF